MSVENSMHEIERQLEEIAAALRAIQKSLEKLTARKS
jgi:prefoldin subunit 5